MLRETVVLEKALIALEEKSEAVMNAKNLLMRDGGILEEQQTASKTREAKLRQEIDASRRFLKSLYENFIKGILTGDEYRSMKSGYETKISTALSEIDVLESERTELTEQAAWLNEAANGISVARSGLTAELTDKLINKVIIYPDKRVEAHFKFDNGGVVTSC